MSPTLRDIALRCGVSRATVSLVLQDSPRVSAATKTKVRAAMEEMGYVYDRRGAHLRSRRSFGVGLVLTDIHNPALAELATALEDAAGESDFVTMMAFTGDDRTKQARAITAMMEYRMDGLVISPAAGSTRDDLAALSRSGMPFVLVTRRLQGVNSDYVGPNNVLGGRMLAEHLADRGARSLAFLGGAVGVSARDERMRGIRQGWSERGLLWSKDLAIATNALEDGGREAVRKLRAIGALPDALVGYSDTVARGMLAELRALGTEPAGTAAIGAFDNDPWAEHLQPSLTSVDTHMTIVGREALSLLSDRIANPDRDPVRMLIKPELHIRQSTQLWVGHDSG